ncbi:HisA/HisF-related TIM barrel protein [Gammaproteobacteria bacterium]|nr:HisA/HisF-related TIM barrel protein [Gammaproteobacteria bacterium]
MLRPRIVVCLLMDGESLIKTRQFKKDKYLGDPLNAIKIFNELEVDELMLLDIKARIDKSPPNFKLISRVAKQCRMPFGYGGGITSESEARQLISEGVEKIVLGDPALIAPSLISEISEVIGAQSTAVILNYKKGFLNRRHLYTKNGSKKNKNSISRIVKQSVDLGAGEIIFYDIDRDGMREGYDLELISKMSRELSVPSLFVGGAGDTSHFSDALNVYKDTGLAAGSFFTLFGKLRTPLISYTKPQL